MRHEYARAGGHPAGMGWLPRPHQPALVVPPERKEAASFFYTHLIRNKVVQISSGPRLARATRTNGLFLAGETTLESACVAPIRD